MSSVTDMFVIVGDSEDGDAEDIAPKVAEAITDFIHGEKVSIPAIAPKPDDTPVISLKRDDWNSLQGGSKVAGSAVIWFGWNYARPEELEAHLKAEGFKHVTVWSHHEFAGQDGEPPRVVSW